MDKSGMMSDFMKGVLLMILFLVLALGIKFLINNMPGA